MRFKFVLGCTVLAAGTAMVVLAATPPSGTLTDTSGPLSYSAGPFNTANASPVPQVDTGPRCSADASSGASQPCDHYALTVTLPAGYAAAHPNGAVKVTMSWTDAGSGNSDYDLYIYKGTVTTTSGAQTANSQSATGANPEIATVSPLVDGSSTYTVIVVPYTPSGEKVNVKIELLPGSGGGGTDPNFGGPDPVVPGAPRYQVFVPPSPSSANSGNGEYNIGFNPKTGRIMNMNRGPIWRVTPAELKSGGGAPKASGLPEACPGLWEDVSADATNTGVDPILWTDSKTGRTFATNSTGGGALVYTDSDGGDPPKSPGAWVAGAGLPNGGADHEGIASGPFPASLSALTTPLNQGQWLLYCSQDLVGSMCQRSLDMGMTWGNGVPATGPGTSGSQGCGGLHGHMHIAPDGTAWIPDKSCGSKQGGALTTDSSTAPWTEFSVQKTVADADGPAFTTHPQTPGGDDPSIGLDSNSTAYYCYVNNEPVAAGNPPEGHVHVAVGKRDAGKTTIKWLRDVDVGASHGIVNASHTEAVGGSAGRAACGFYGTNVPGNYQAGDFAGNWYVLIATTYDEGKTWVTVNATPNDPVQHASGIWQQGGGNQDRNLLDFNEVTLDDKGRVLYGYSDGCVTDACIAGTAANDFTAYMRVARQYGGNSLLASKDAAEPAAPKPACLLDAKLGHSNPSTRDADASHLKWNAPDHGGAAITDYKIYRGTATGNEVFLRNSGSARNSFNDYTADPNEPLYTYKVIAINAQGEGLFSNEVSLPIGTTTVQSICASPGLTVLTDATGDTLGAGSNAPAYDVQSLSLAQPYSGNVGTAPSFTDYKVYFQLKMASLATVPENALWPISFCAPNIETSATNGALVSFASCATTNPNAAQTATSKYYTVRMSTVPPGTPATPVFEILKPNAADTTRKTIAADGASNFKADGRITIVAKASDLGLTNAGAGTEALSKFLVRIGENIGAGTVTPDNMPDSLAGAGTFQTVVKNFCAPNAPPIAVLAVDRNSGPAPLTVNFDASASHEPDAQDTIASYKFNFKDGSEPVVQSTPLISYTYQSPGTYGPTLTVTDSRGLDSISTADSTQVIEVVAPPAPPPGVGNNVLGGALSGLSLGVLGLLGALGLGRERRSSKPK